MKEEIIRTIIEIVLSPFTYIIVPMAVIFINMFRKYNNYMDIRDIFKEQYEIFKDDKTTLFIIYILPISIAIGIARIRSIDKDIIDNINVVLSILVAMFFSMQALIASFSNSKSDNYKKLIKQTNSTINFEIVLSIILLINSFIFMFIQKIDNGIIQSVFSVIIYYLSIIVLLNIFIVLKRTKVLWDKKE